MKIKIPPYPNYKITKECYKESIINSIDKKESSGLSNHLIMIAPFKNGEQRVINIRPVRYNNNLYISAFPNPIHLFLSLAIEHFIASEQFKIDNFPKCGRRFGEDIYILDIEENGTHSCYNSYFKYRISCIIMLVSSLESYMNYIIPNDFIYKTIRNTKDKEFNKKDLEGVNVSFREKLIEVVPKLPQSIINGFDWENLQTEKSIILDLYKNRKNLIHLKTEAKNDFDMYILTIDKMLDFDIHLAINSIVKFMNTATPNFINFESE